MQEPTEITITIDKQGRTEMEVDGVKGQSCTNLTEKLVEAIGFRVSEELKPEYYARDGQVEIRNRGK